MVTYSGTTRPDTKLCTAFVKPRRGIQQPAYQFNLKPAVTLLLLVVCPTSVTAVVTCSGP